MFWGFCMTPRQLPCSDNIFLWREWMENLIIHALFPAALLDELLSVATVTSASSRNLKKVSYGAISREFRVLTNRSARFIKKRPSPIWALKGKLPLRHKHQRQVLNHHCIWIRCEVSKSGAKNSIIKSFYIVFIFIVTKICIKLVKLFLMNDSHAFLFHFPIYFPFFRQLIDCT